MKKCNVALVDLGFGGSFVDIYKHHPNVGEVGIFEMNPQIMAECAEYYGITDLHPGADALVSMRGPQNLCYDTFDYPEFIRNGSMDLLPGFTKIYDELYRMTTKYQQGSTCWMGVWHPKKWYPVSCDFSSLLPP